MAGNLHITKPDSYNQERLSQTRISGHTVEMDSFVSGSKIRSGSSSDWSDIKKIKIWTIPSTPYRPIGPTNVVVGHHFNYQTRSFDSCGNPIKYRWWVESGYTVESPYYWKSGAWANEDLIFPRQGIYYIKVAAINTQGKMSDWSDPLRVTAKWGLLRKNWPLLDAFGYSYSTIG